MDAAKNFLLAFLPFVAIYLGALSVVRNDIKKLEKDGTSEDICKSAEEQVQNLTNTFIKKIDELLAVKEAEIMKV